MSQEVEVFTISEMDSAMTRGLESSHSLRKAISFFKSKNDCWILNPNGDRIIMSFSIRRTINL